MTDPTNNYGSSFYGTAVSLQGPQGPKGDTGEQGPPGPDGAAGPAPTVSQLNAAAVYALSLSPPPKGDKGDQGIQGPAGNNATVSVGATTTGDPGTQATVTNIGTASAAIFAFTVPQGPVGPQGPQGPQGIPGGAAPTVAPTFTAASGVVGTGSALLSGNGSVGSSGYLQILNADGSPNAALGGQGATSGFTFVSYGGYGFNFSGGPIRAESIKINGSPAQTDVDRWFFFHR